MTSILLGGMRRKESDAGIADADISPQSPFITNAYQMNRFHVQETLN
jgi:hypothetical protein